ncbi:hypothetical protein A2U01_0053444 [Trifolium medium]|uniref:Uncharacterized protein n=1 Tax=Trifolium medium TaxID=97028 RepID=A0A392R6K9_9FABA|nr:hypothetical protein [Trifolium medium]
MVLRLRRIRAAACRDGEGRMARIKFVTATKEIVFGCSGAHPLFSVLFRNIDYKRKTSIYT